VIRLTEGYKEMKDEPRIKDFLGKVNQYNKDLRRLRLDDSTVSIINYLNIMKKG